MRGGGAGPAEVLTCAGDYTVRQADIDAGSLSNSAQVSGVSPQGDAVTDDTVLVVEMPVPAPSLTLVKTATPAQFGEVGSTLTYLFTIENTGNVTLSDLVLTDVLVPDYTCEIASLAPGVTDRTCTLEVEVTQDMVDAGGIDNAAAVTATDPNGTDVSAEAALFTDGPAQRPALDATKVALPTPGVVGAEVPFVLTVQNTGNVTLETLQIVDQMVDGDGNTVFLDAPFALTAASDTGADGLLSVGEVWTYEARVTLTQDIVNSGGLSNQVTANAVGPGDVPVSDLSDDGDDADGNSENDRTEFEIWPSPRCRLSKALRHPAPPWAMKSYLRSRRPISVTWR